MYGSSAFSRMSKPAYSEPLHAYPTSSKPIRKKQSWLDDASSKHEQPCALGMPSSPILRQPSMPLRIAMTCHPCLLPAIFPQSSLARDLAMGSLPFPLELQISTPPSERSTRSPPSPCGPRPPNPPIVATMGMATRTGLAKNPTSDAPGTIAKSPGLTSCMGSSAWQQSWGS